MEKTLISYNEEKRNAQDAFAKLESDKFESDRKIIELLDSVEALTQQVECLKATDSKLDQHLENTAPGFKYKDSEIPYILKEVQNSKQLIRVNVANKV
jgi:hypothetical protein